MTAPPSPADDIGPPAMRAALHARAIAGDDAAAGDEARRDGFAAFLYGMAVAFASRDETDPDAPLAERVDTLATRMVREALRMPFREACRCVEAVADALASREPDAALAGFVHTGAAAAADWMDGDAGAFESRVMQATAGESFASERALRARR